MLALPPRPQVLLLDAGNTVVFLDDGVVADRLAREGVFGVTPERVRAAQGPAKREYERALVGGLAHERGWFVYMEALLTIAGAPVERAEALARALREEHDAMNLWRRVPDGLTLALERGARSGLRFGVVSNSEGRVAELLEAVGLGRFFEVVVDSGRAGIQKPDPRIFLLATTPMGVDPADAIYVGDVPHVDVEGARAAGLGAVLVDAFDDYPEYDGGPRVRSVAELIDAWM